MIDPNGVILQAFQWHLPADGNHWNWLAGEAQKLHDIGITAIWIPPPYKAIGGKHDVGYGVYDLYDLGEFDQKGSVPTKYGTRDQLLAATKAMHDAGLQVYGDVVLNHRMGADEQETVSGNYIKKADRLATVGEASNISAWTKFTFSGRNDKYNTFKWNWFHFNAAPATEMGPEGEDIVLLKGKHFSDEVSDEMGNFDYLMGCDVDFSHPEVNGELHRWGRWYIDQLELDGLRLDALKHIPSSFFRNWLNFLRMHYGERELVIIGEYWHQDAEALKGYLDAAGHTMQLFDVALHQNFHNASKSGNGYDLSKIFEHTLVQAYPSNAVTFVDNHDTEPDQPLSSWVEDWFKPMAYALILLREKGYPCVAHADLYGGGTFHNFQSHWDIIAKLMDLRHKFAHGEEWDFFDHPNCVAWVRAGTEETNHTMVVVMTNGDAGTKRVKTNRHNAKFTDHLGYQQGTIETDGEGFADFTCPPGSMAVWVSE